MYLPLTVADQTIKFLLRFSFIGCGIIRVPPHIVWESVRNPLSRFSYDSLLKVDYYIFSARKLTCPLCRLCLIADDFNLYRFQLWLLLLVWCWRKFEWRGRDVLLRKFADKLLSLPEFLTCNNVNVSFCRQPKWLLQASSSLAASGKCGGLTPHAPTSARPLMNCLLKLRLLYTYAVRLPRYICIGSTS